MTAQLNYSPAEWEQIRNFSSKQEKLGFPQLFPYILEQKQEKTSLPNSKNCDYLICTKTSVIK